MRRGKQQFVVGKQPEWAGTEDVDETIDPVRFISTLLREDPSDSLISRGYCVVRLDDAMLSLYSQFHSAFEKFVALPTAEKEKYAYLQFDPSVYSPNQYHGYSVVHGLKEQFMMRIGGGSCPELQVPEDLGTLGAQFYERCDLLCRTLAHKAVQTVGYSPKLVDAILDPIFTTGSVPSREDQTSATEFIPKGYIGSSILDNFYYYNKFEKVQIHQNENKESSEGVDQFYNNHAAHTDSGLLTVVVTTDNPGLELVDQKEGKWVAIERLLHAFAKQQAIAAGTPDLKLGHRRYAIIFWSDSIEYILKGGKDNLSSIYSKANALPLACLHRVQRCDSGRYSVVFKQRTTPLKTACRYQEDFPLAKRQLEAMEATTSLSPDATEWRDALYQVVNRIETGNSNPFFYVATCVTALLLAQGVLAH